MAKKTTNKPKAKLSTKKTVKEKAKPSPKNKKEIKEEKPSIKTEKIQLTQDV